jgi:membrane protease YdiL (CAAX protease family)
MVRWEGIPLRDVGATAGRNTLPRFFFGFCIGMVMAGVVAMAPVAAGYVHWVRTPEVGPSIALLAAGSYVALACREELSFRGYPLFRLAQPLGVWGAQTFVAVAFAAEHVAGGWAWQRALLGAGVGSLLFGMVAISTRGLAVPIGLHAAWNFGQWAMGFKPESPSLFTAVVVQEYRDRAESLGVISYLLVTVLATAAFWLWHRRRSRPIRIEFDRAG